MSQVTERIANVWPNDEANKKQIKKSRRMKMSQMKESAKTWLVEKIYKYS